MICGLAFIQVIFTEDRASGTQAILLGINVFATGHSAGTIKARNDLGLEKFGSHDLSHLLGVFLDALAVSLDWTFPANTFLGIRSSERYFNSDCLLHLFPPICIYSTMLENILL
jgi:hypothetical protein